MRLRDSLIDIVVWFFSFVACLFGSNILVPQRAFAFTKLKNGFEIITSTYLVPLSLAVAGAAFMVYIIMSYFKQDEYQKKVGNVMILTGIGAGGLELLKKISQSFG
ncbi:MAG: hypothetical protein KAQ98_12980 [Bacteriovoracaceae bacterium]|nr:hypothetical protein [Bacteriovoracaceae bacterium]